MTVDLLILGIIATAVTVLCARQASVERRINADAAEMHRLAQDIRALLPCDCEICGEKMRAAAEACPHRMEAHRVGGAA